MKSLVLASMLCCGAALAQPVVSDAWVRPTVPGQSAGGGYLRIANKGGAADRLLGASTGVSASAELHSMTMDGDVMRMRRVEAIDIPAGGTVELKPGGLHLMLMGLKAPLKAGTQVPLTLTFERAGDVKVEARVEARAPAKGHGHHH